MNISNSVGSNLKFFSWQTKYYCACAQARWLQKVALQYWTSQAEAKLVQQPFQNPFGKKKKKKLQKVDMFK